MPTPERLVTDDLPMNHPAVINKGGELDNKVANFMAVCFTLLTCHFVVVFLPMFLFSCIINKWHIFTLLFIKGYLYYRLSIFTSYLAIAITLVDAYNSKTLCTISHFCTISLTRRLMPWMMVHKTDPSPQRQSSQSLRSFPHLPLIPQHPAKRLLLITEKSLMHTGAEMLILLQITYKQIADSNYWNYIFYLGSTTYLLGILI